MLIKKHLLLGAFLFGLFYRWYSKKMRNDFLVSHYMCLISTKLGKRSGSSSTLKTSKTIRKKRLNASFYYYIAASKFSTSHTILSMYAFTIWFWTGFADESDIWSSTVTQAAHPIQDDVFVKTCHVAHQEGTVI